MEEQKQNLQPVVVASEAWHLSRAQALGEAMHLVETLRPEEGMTMTLEDFCAKVSARLGAERRAAVTTYLKNSDRELTEVIENESAIQARFDEERAVPVVEIQLDGGKGWDIVDLAAPSGDGMSLVVPFRPVDLERLHPDRVVVKLLDHYHAATAALAEVLRAAYQAASSAFIAADARAAWMRLQSLLNVYRQTAKFALGKLQEDDYVGWSPTTPMRVEISNSAGLIVQVAATSNAQCAIAAHLMATWMQSLKDATEELHSNGTADRERAFMGSLKQALDTVETTLQALNTSAAAPHWRSEDPFESFVVFRPIPRGMPVLVIVPKAKDPVARITKRKRPK